MICRFQSRARCVPALRSLSCVTTLCPKCAACLLLAGVSRNEETLQPTLYLSKLPERFDPTAHVLVTDPMLATGVCPCPRHSVPGPHTPLARAVWRAH